MNKIDIEGLADNYIRNRWNEMNPKLWSDEMKYERNIFIDGVKSALEVVVSQPEPELINRLNPKDRVTLPFGETGTVVRFDERLWGNRYWVRIRKSNGFNETNSIVDFFPNQIELEK